MIVNTEVSVYARLIRLLSILYGIDGARLHEGIVHALPRTSQPHT